MSTAFYVSAFIEILHYISDDLLQCDAGTTLAEVFSDEFDDLDFELALTCFEATYKIAFKDSVWKTDVEEFDELTLEEFFERNLNPKEQTDPLFVTKRFLFYEQSLTKALREEYEGPPPEELD